MMAWILKRFRELKAQVSVTIDIGLGETNQVFVGDAFEQVVVALLHLGGLLVQD